MEYWNVTENPSGIVYKNLIKALCDHSDKFQFVMRKQLKYNLDVLHQFQPYVICHYEASKWANTITKGNKAIVYVIEANNDTCTLLQQNANQLYDWVSPKLPEDLTFIKNNFEWFSSTTHEEYAYFRIHSDHYWKLIHKIKGLKLERVE